jgi:hypothetical protein
MKVVIPSPLFSYTGGQRIVEAGGETLTQLLERLDVRFPGMRHRIVDEQGAIRRTSVSSTASRRRRESRPNTKVLIVAALSGG